MSVAFRVVADLHRDGIATADPGPVMGTLAHLAAAMLAALDVSPLVPDEEPADGPGVVMPGGGWLSGPSNPDK